MYCVHARKKGVKRGRTTPPQQVNGSCVFDFFGGGDMGWGCTPERDDVFFASLDLGFELPCSQFRLFLFFSFQSHRTFILKNLELVV